MNATRGTGPEEGGSTIARAVIFCAAAVIVLAGVKAAEPVVVQILLGLFIATICAGVVQLLERMRIPRGIAVAATLLGLVFLGLLIFGLIGTAFFELPRQLPAYKERFNSMIVDGLEGAKRFGVKIPEESLRGFVESADIFGFVSSIFSSLWRALNHFLVLVVIVAFVLGESFGFSRKLRAAFSDPADGDSAIGAVERTVGTVKRFIGIKAAVSLMLAGAVAALLAFSPVPHPVIWSLLAFLLNFIPIIGALLAAIPPIVIAFINGGWAPALWIGLGFMGITTVLFNFVEPMMMGRQLGLSPLVVILSIIFWGWLLGPVGMLLGVPLMMAIKIALELDPRWRWLAALLDSAPGAVSPPKSAA